MVGDVTLFNKYLKNEKYDYSKFYYLNYLVESKDPNYFMVFCNLNDALYLGNDFLKTCDDISIFSHSKYRKFNIYVSNNNSSLPIFVDSVKLPTTNFGYIIPINKNYPGNELLKTNITGDGIDPDNILLSYYDPPLTSLSPDVYALWQDGCYGPEGSGVLSLHWCSQKGTLQLVNKTKKNIPVKIEAEFRTEYQEYSKLIISSKDFVDTLQVNTSPIEYIKKVVVKPGINEILLVSDVRKTAAVNDPRDVRFAVLNFDIE